MRLSPVSLRAVPLPAIAVALSLGLVAQEPGTEEVLHLPTYTVTAGRELPPPEHWHYVRLPGFEVLSNASESTRATRYGSRWASTDSIANRPVAAASRS